MVCLKKRNLTSLTNAYIVTQASSVITTPTNGAQDLHENLSVLEMQHFLGYQIEIKMN